MRIFSYESRFSQVLLKLSYSCWLNVLWFLCSIPIVTIGASTAALYSVTLKIAADRETGITKEFFQAFRENFPQATRLWLCSLLLGIALAADLVLVTRLRSSSTGPAAVFWTLILALLIGAVVLFVITLTYLFPLIAYFRNDDVSMVKNAFLTGTRYLFSTILIFAIHFAMFYLIVSVFTPFAIFGEGLCAMLSSFLIINVFRVLSQNSQEKAS